MDNAPSVLHEAYKRKIFLKYFWHQLQPVAGGVQQGSGHDEWPLTMSQAGNGHFNAVQKN